jgi:thioredoxin-related protein
MKNILSSLNESEKIRILEMHKNATRKNYIKEQPIDPFATLKNYIDELGFEEEKKLSEVTLSAWLPFDAAKQRASEKGGDILVYFYNDGCHYCENFTKNVMSNETIRKKIVENNLTLCKIVMCVPEGKENIGHWEGKETIYTTCDDSQREVWKRFEDQVTGVPSMVILDSSGDKVKARTGIHGNPTIASNAQDMALSLMNKI